MKLSRSLHRAVALALLAAAAAPARAADVKVELLAPRNGDRVGAQGRGWFIDLAIRFDVPLAQTGAGLQITGPAGHASIPPLPGTFSLGADDRLPGLLVLVSTTASGAGSCQNVANLFNLTGIGDVTERSTEILDTWIVGAANFGTGTWSTTYAAVAADRNGNGVYDDAPGVVPDADGDGTCDAEDLRAFGVASNVARAQFFVNP
jgi:hypothetical protein